MAERRRPSTNVLLARKVRELEKRMRALEVGKALTYAADEEVIALPEATRGAVGDLLDALYFHERNASKLYGLVWSALGKLAPKLSELAAEKNPAAAWTAFHGEETGDG